MSEYACERCGSDDLDQTAGAACVALGVAVICRPCQTINDKREALTLLREGLVTLANMGEEIPAVCIETLTNGEHNLARLEAEVQAQVRGWTGR
jgi:hypothetical protein